ncbi:MAG: hypothetical protein LAP13_20395, partial [Acidobacteriia bacterium]|nr:hypothetical protein [Terriglobia bacterium]
SAIVSKRIGEGYRSGRGETWTKSKCRSRDEFLVGGWTRDKNGRGLRRRSWLNFRDVNFNKCPSISRVVKPREYKLRPRIARPDRGGGSHRYRAPRTTPLFLRSRIMLSLRGIRAREAGAE